MQKLSYTGSAITPVTVKDGETTLTKDTDYTVSYTDNVNVGTAAATITGMGRKYIGTATKTFTIVKAMPGVEHFDLPSLSVTYDGTAKSVPATLKAGLTGAGTITVKYNGNTTAPTNVGTYSVTFDVAGGDNFYAATGLSIGTLTINPASVTLTANSRNTDVYDGTEKTVTGFTASVDGLTFADTVTASGSGTNAGEYGVTFSGVTVNTTTDTTGNYVVTGTTNGTLTVAQKEVGLSWSDTTFVEQPLRCEKYTSRPPAKPPCFVQTAILSCSLTESKILLSIRCQ